MVKIIQIMEEHILGLTSKEVVSILAKIPFHSERLTVLKSLKDLITDAENKFVIIASYDFSSDKEKARKILESVKPRSFIYGQVKAKRVIFVIDTSGSMEAVFTTNTGQRYNRLEFVGQELNKVLSTQLTSDMKFNIILFSSGVSPWKPGLQPVNADSIKLAQAFAAKMRPGGGTNIYGSLEKAFADKEVKAIYFLTDGRPTEGKKQDMNGIIKDVKQWNMGRNIPIHATAFLMGNHSSDNKAKSRELMQKLAEVTKGVYRAIE